MHRSPQHVGVARQLCHPDQGCPIARSGTMITLKRTIMVERMNRKMTRRPGKRNFARL
jgi:hypothetical protein